MNFANCFTISCIFYDGSTNNPIAPFSPVSLAATAMYTSAAASGLRMFGSQLVVPPSFSTNTVASTAILGVTTGPSNPKTGEVTVAVSGIAKVWANAAVAQGALLQAVAATTRTSAQTPFTSLEEALIPTDPTLTRTYNIVLGDDTAIVPQSGSANVAYFPVGLVLEPATAQYDVIDVLLQTQVIYA